ncbi:MAG TPA: phage holin family protein [Candidatus Saccharimonadaceae bacterium]|nr:phage holin family protein [Candidatus Saccharimonadaceae bacterium]
MKQQFAVFLVRWALNSFGLWIAVRLLGTGYQDVEVTAGFWGFLLAGLIFSLVNSIFKPLAVILSLPAILLTLGLFVLVVNGSLVYVSLLIAPGISMSFVNSILTGIILSLVNYIVSAAVEIRRSKTGV